MRPELEAHTRRGKLRCFGDFRAYVGQRHCRAPPYEKVSSRDTAACRTDNGDLLATNGEISRCRHRSFSVLSVNNAKMMERMMKRVMTFGSLHPISSKWWWMGAILKMRFPRSLNEPTCRM